MLIVGFIRRAIIRRRIFFEVFFILLIFFFLLLSLFSLRCSCANMRRISYNSKFIKRWSRPISKASILERSDSNAFRSLGSMHEIVLRYAILLIYRQSRFPKRLIVLRLLFWEGRLRGGIFDGGYLISTFCVCILRLNIIHNTAKSRNLHQTINNQNKSFCERACCMCLG